MVERFAVDTTDLRADADVWQRWRERLDAVRAAVPTVGRGFDALAFSILPGAQDVAVAYATLAAGLVDQLAVGGRTMSGIAGTLDVVARLYDDRDQETADSVAKV